MQQYWSIINASLANTHHHAFTTHMAVYHFRKEKKSPYIDIDIYYIDVRNFKSPDLTFNYIFVIFSPFTVTLIACPEEVSVSEDDKLLTINCTRLFNETILSRIRIQSQPTNPIQAEGQYYVNFPSCM